MVMIKFARPCCSCSCHNDNNDNNNKRTNEANKNRSNQNKGPDEAGDRGLGIGGFDPEGTVHANDIQINMRYPAQESAAATAQTTAN